MAHHSGTLSGVGYFAANNTWPSSRRSGSTAR